MLLARSCENQFALLVLVPAPDPPVQSTRQPFIVQSGSSASRPGSMHHTRRRPNVLAIATCTTVLASVVLLQRSGAVPQATQSTEFKEPYGEASDKSEVAGSSISELLRENSSGCAFRGPPMYLLHRSPGPL